MKKKKEEDWTSLTQCTLNSPGTDPSKLSLHAKGMQKGPVVRIRYIDLKMFIGSVFLVVFYKLGQKLTNLLRYTSNDEIKQDKLTSKVPTEADRIIQLIFVPNYKIHNI